MKIRKMRPPRCDRRIKRVSIPLAVALSTVLARIDESSGWWPTRRRDWTAAQFDSAAADT